MLLVFALLIVGDFVKPNWEVNIFDLEEPAAGFSGMVVAPSGQVFFLDGQSGHIYRLDPDGTPRGYFGRTGEGPGEIRDGLFLQYDTEHKRLLVTDYGKSALIPFGMDGTGGPAINLDRNTIKADPIVISGNRILLLKTFYSDLQLNRGAEVYIQDPASGQSTTVASLNASEQGDPLMVIKKDSRHIYGVPWIPQALIAYAPRQKIIFVGTTSALAFRLFDAETGMQIGEIKDADIPRVPLTDEMIDKDLNLFKLKRSTIDSSIPESLPVLDSAVCDTAGRLWVRFRQLQSNQALYRVYNVEGKPAGVVKMNPFRHVVYADDHHIWGRRFDPESGDQFIFKADYQLLSP